MVKKFFLGVLFSQKSLLCIEMLGVLLIYLLFRSYAASVLLSLAVVVVGVLWWYILAYKIPIPAFHAIGLGFFFLYSMSQLYFGLRAYELAIWVSLLITAASSLGVIALMVIACSFFDYD